MRRRCSRRGEKQSLKALDYPAILLGRALDSPRVSLPGDDLSSARRFILIVFLTSHEERALNSSGCCSFGGFGFRLRLRATAFAFVSLLFFFFRYPSRQFIGGPSRIPFFDTRALIVLLSSLSSGATYLRKSISQSLPADAAIVHTFVRLARVCGSRGGARFFGFASRPVSASGL